MSVLARGWSNDNLAHQDSGTLHYGLKIIYELQDQIQYPGKLY